MNILVPHSWLKEFLETSAKPEEIAKYLSLCSQSVEKITKTDNDYIYEIEITTNRSDCLSIYGIARELAVILPRFGIKTKLKKIKLGQIPENPVKNLPLKVKITKSSLCPRFTALIFDNIKIGPSPKIIQKRLKKVGIRALNNVVDISNYLMVELGQPMHTFDYDKVKKATMILREAKQGEKIITLDNQERILPQGTIVIEDGEGKIIDLCGIMGGQNSEVDENTKRVLLFVQTYNPAIIRKTCQLLSFRTEAAQRFEKGVDPEGVIPAIRKAILMFEENCNAKVASKLIDIYPNPPKPKKIILSSEKLNQVLGIPFSLREAGKILKSLGFETKLLKKKLQASPPHWRYEDINIAEDLIEEIARIYGYHLLPSELPSGKIPIKPVNKLLMWEEKIKDMLKYWGFFETVSYSMISKNWLETLKIPPEICLKISNPLSLDLEFMRPTLIPSLLNVIKENENWPEIKIFEISNIYLPQGKNQLPKEISTLSIACDGNSFFNLKGVVENIFKELQIENFNFEQKIPNSLFYSKIFSSSYRAKITVENSNIGFIGEIKTEVLNKFGIAKKVNIVELNLPEVIKFFNPIKKYSPISNYPPIIEDLAFIVNNQTKVGEVIQLIKQISPTIKSVDLIDVYKNTRTFRIVYQSYQKTLTDEEIKRIREKIVEALRKKFKIKLKS